MALPMVLALLLFGAVLVAAALYVVENMYSTTKQTIAHTHLYNAAQTGMERAKNLLWNNRADLESDPLTYNGDISSVYARTESGTIMGPMGFNADPGISVTVLILDCNYELGAGQIYNSDLPPQFPPGSGGAGGTSALPGGTSAIIDPGRFLPFGPGGAGGHGYVIRSRASKGGKDFIIEGMVVVTE